MAVWEAAWLVSRCCDVISGFVISQAQQQLQTREAEWTALQERDRNLRITNPMIKKQVCWIQPHSCERLKSTAIFSRLPMMLTPFQVDALKVLGSELEQARSLTQDQQTQLAEAQIRSVWFLSGRKIFST